MKKVGILVGREQTFPESIIKSINEKSGGKIMAEMVKVGGIRMDEAKQYDLVIEFQIGTGVVGPNDDHGRTACGRTGGRQTRAPVARVAVRVARVRRALARRRGLHGERRRPG